MGERIKRTSLEIPEDFWLRWKVQAAREGVSMRDLLLRQAGTSDSRHCHDSSTVIAVNEQLVFSQDFD